MSDNDVKTGMKVKTASRPKTQRPRLHKVLLLNDDYTPREFVVAVLCAIFRTSEDETYNIMMMAHQKGVCVVAVYTREVAETKSTEANALARNESYPLTFTTEPEE
ncbi:ATP-dependent Clp protease adaptor ClpS [Alphaproteobacteria bacterium]|nr:ATP-dependent Clp protease adaptor ClpS [Alphaproteobacteria bacterium]